MSVRPRQYDTNLTVIGAGSAGLIASLIAATVRAKVTLIERGEMGGDCLNTGCVPSKTLIRSAKVAQQARDGARYGLKNVSFDVDFAAVMARVKEAVATIAPNDSVARYTELGVDCVLGDARLADPWTVEVGDRSIRSRNIVLATGASPWVPPIPGLETVAPLTSDNLWDLDELPRRLLVMGGGPIGCELAQAFARLGSQVTLIDMAERILPREDTDVSALIEGRLAVEGIRVLTGHRAERFEVVDGQRRLITRGSGGETSLDFDRVLVAVGRKPTTDGLDLEALGVERHSDGTVVVDDYLRTSVPSIFACGDVVGPYQFTHMASHQAWYAAVNALFGRFRKFKVNYDVVPWTTYTDPEVARVGLNEIEAAERGLAVEVTTRSLAHLDRAIADGTTEGFIKVLTVPGKDRVLGATIVAPEGGELISEYILAMTHGLGLKKLMGTIHVYPTLAELNKFAASDWRRAHAPEWVFPWLRRFHALLR
jgi:pyruvate/2-oxoglutarate dehydrogenase complex dihydrolipoamide dehydrogenase (E3) component